MLFPLFVRERASLPRERDAQSRVTRTLTPSSRVLSCAIVMCANTPSLPIRGCSVRSPRSPRNGPPRTHSAVRWLSFLTPPLPALTPSLVSACSTLLSDSVVAPSGPLWLASTPHNAEYPRVRPPSLHLSATRSSPPSRLCFPSQAILERTRHHSHSSSLLRPHPPHSSFLLFLPLPCVLIRPLPRSQSLGRRVPAATTSRAPCPSATGSRSPRARSGTVGGVGDSGDVINVHGVPRSPLRVCTAAGVIPSGAQLLLLLRLLSSPSVLLHDALHVRAHGVRVKVLPPELVPARVAGATADLGVARNAFHRTGADDVEGQHIRRLPAQRRRRHRCQPR